MNRFRTCLYINLVMGLVLIPVTISGVILRFALPGGVRGAGQATLWGITRSTWIDVHFWVTVMFLVLILLHLLVHLKYIKRVPEMLKQG